MNERTKRRISMKVQKLKALDGFSRESDNGVVVRATAVYEGTNGNPNFKKLPFDLAEMKTDIDKFSGSVVTALDGSKKAIAEKNKLRDAVIKKVRLLARYVEAECQEDIAVFKSSGLAPASSTKTAKPPLSEKIRKIEHGAVSGQI